MGVYACNKCFEEHKLEAGNGISGYYICEICNEIHKDSESKWCSFTWSVTRFKPVKKQLEQWAKHIKEY